MLISGEEGGGVGEFPPVENCCHKPIEQEAQWKLSRRNVKKIIVWHIIIKLLKTSEKEKILKRSRQKIAYRGTKIRTAANFFLEVWNQQGQHQKVKKLPTYNPIPG